MSLLSLKQIGQGALVLVVLLMAGSWVYNWYKPAPLVNPVQFTPAPPIKGTESIKIITVPGPVQIVTVEKEKIVEKLKLPDEIAKNPDLQVTSTATVAPYEGKTDAIAVMNTRTGESEIQIKQEPLPFFQFLNKKEIGVRAGIATSVKNDVPGMQYHGVLYGRWTFLRVAGAKVAAYVEGNTNPEGKAMLDVRYEWE